MANLHDLILVTGATGTQGGATLAQLLARGHRVRALTRNPEGERARALSEMGAEVFRGDYDDPASIETALRGVSGVFSVQVPSMEGNDIESRHGALLVEAAKRAGVRHFVHASVSGTDLYKSMPPGTESLWDKPYWDSKLILEETVRAANFPTSTFLRAAFLMENYVAPKVGFAFPEFHQGEIVIAMDMDTKLAHVAAQDMGAFAVAAFENPDRFNGKSLELAGDKCTIPEVAAVLSRVTGHKVSAICLTPLEASARGKYPLMVQHQEWANKIGYPVSIEELRGYGVPLTDFPTWAEANKDAIKLNLRPIEKS
ncbi:MULTISPECIES: NmrA/HSCARG family protein [Nostocales]|uniref:NmrA/HSCARG family protein n=3 Tax=Nostocales TaxID=1161 RepID=A0A0C1RA21_9CYAN|nr:NmrA/HSCARG family protein [Tolypothrix bouteillei]KAF3890285.1 NmrA/HSCARG family protein [Tolypothrix bouteillei VB521301]